MDSFFNNWTRPHRNVNLQYFAEGDRTEKATPKKKQDVRKKGQVLQSRELNTVLVLICVFFGLKLLGGFIYSEFESFFVRTLEVYSKDENIFNFSMLSNIFYDCAAVFLSITGPILAIALITGITVNYAQVGFLFTTEALAFKFERINPISGFKRIFSSRALVELIKASMKILIIGYAVYVYLKGKVHDILNLMAMDTDEIAGFIGSTAIEISLRICLILLALAVLDYFYQWWEYEKNLRMTKQDIKDEYKQAEGNPEVKSKIKQKQRQMSMNRMIQEIPKADVVITNPTHFAVAVKYDQKVSDAPIVIAKGQDYMAQRIREIAKENRIEIVENKPLARTLYSSVEIGEAIPPDLYQAVAEILAFVYSLKR